MQVRMHLVSTKVVPENDDTAERRFGERRVDVDLLEMIPDDESGPSLGMVNGPSISLLNREQSANNDGKSVEEKELELRWKKYESLMQEHADNWKISKQDAIENANDEFLKLRRRQEDAEDSNGAGEIMVRDGSNRVQQGEEEAEQEEQYNTSTNDGCFRTFV
jgi:hypothetical protein